MSRVQTPTRPALFVLSTPHPESVMGFYRAVLGWELSPSGARPIGSDQRVILQIGDGGWLPYLSVADLDLAMTSIEAAGGQLGRPVQTHAEGRLVIAVDPSRTPLGLLESSDPGGTPVADDAPVVWIEQKTRDQDVATSFLEEMFGFSAVGPRGAGQVRVLRQNDGTAYAGVMQFDDRWTPDHPPHWLLYASTSDVDLTLETATRSGGSIWFTPVQTPLGRLAYIRDPEGNAIAVVKVAPEAIRLLRPPSDAATSGS